MIAPIGKTLEEMEMEMILGALANTNGSRKETALMLGITTRTLTNKLNAYRLQGVTIPSGRGQLVKSNGCEGK